MAWFTAQQRGSAAEFTIARASPAGFLALAEGNGKAVAFIGAGKLKVILWSSKGFLELLCTVQSCGYLVYYRVTQPPPQYLD